MMKNLVKGMAAYGEMISRIGAWFQQTILLFSGVSVPTAPPLIQHTILEVCNMKFQFMKNLKNAMAEYGEMLNVTGQV